jgi:hypothetical protein
LVCAYGYGTDNRNLFPFRQGFANLSQFVPCRNPEEVCLILLPFTMAAVNRHRESCNLMPGLRDTIVCVLGQVADDDKFVH